MKLEEFVNESIYSYPTLYRGDNHEDSRLCVLGHIFLAYGTALEWNPDGYLEYIGHEPDNSYKCVLESLPEGFYDMDLWYVDCPENRIEELQILLGDDLNYYKSGYDYGNRCCIFSSTEEKALEITKIFEKDKIPPEFRSEGYNRRPHEASSFCRKHRDNSIGLSRLKQAYYMAGYSPYPMCHYSPIVEMINKRTDSNSPEDFDLVNIRPDWIKGALDISRYCLDWYNNKDNYQYLSCYPPKSIKEDKENYDKDPEKYRAERAEGEKQWGGPVFTDDMTIEDYCEGRFNQFLDEQIGYFKTFIEMYGTNYEN